MKAGIEYGPPSQRPTSSSAAARLAASAFCTSLTQPPIFDFSVASEADRGRRDRLQVRGGSFGFGPDGGDL